MAGAVKSRPQPVPASTSRRGTEESPLVKWMLIAIALAFCLVFLLLPLVNVFAQALAKGWGYYWTSLQHPDSLGGHSLDLARRGHQCAVECGVRPRGGMGDCEVRFSRQIPADHAD